jgi:DNA recombination protein RmuC
MLGHLDKLGTALGSGVTAYNRAIASLESRVLVTGRRFTELQGLPIPLDPPRQVDQQPRSLASQTHAHDILDELEHRALEAGEPPSDTTSTAVA